MAFCTKSMFNSLVTACTPKSVIASFKHWIGVSDEYASWLNEPEQKKLWKPGGQPFYNNMVGPDTANEEPGAPAAPLVYHPAWCELPPEMMFMHDAVFSEEEPVEDVDLKIPEYKDNWWNEVDADENIRRRGRDRVQDYLDNSEKVEWMKI